MDEKGLVVEHFDHKGLHQLQTAQNITPTHWSYLVVVTTAAYLRQPASPGAPKHSYTMNEVIQ